MSLRDAIADVCTDVINSLSVLRLRLLTSDGAKPLVIRHQSGAKLELKNDGKVYYNGTEIGTGSGGVEDHGALTGLLDDDHTQYLPIDGSRGMSGDLDIGLGNDLKFDTNGYIDAGVDTWDETQVYGLNLNGDDFIRLYESTYGQIALFGWDITFNTYLSMSGNQIINVSTPTDANDAATKNYVDTYTYDHGGLSGLGDDDHTQYLLVNGTRVMSGNIQMNGNKITNLATPSSNSDAATKEYVDNNAGGDVTNPMTSDLDTGGYKIYNDSGAVTFESSTGVFVFQKSP